MNSGVNRSDVCHCFTKSFLVVLSRKWVSVIGYCQFVKWIMLWIHNDQREMNRNYFTAHRYISLLITKGKIWSKFEFQGLWQTLKTMKHFKPWLTKSFPMKWLSVLTDALPRNIKRDSIWNRKHLLSLISTCFLHRWHFIKQRHGHLLLSVYKINKWLYIHIHDGGESNEYDLTAHRYIIFLIDKGEMCTKIQIQGLWLTYTTRNISSHD